MTLVSTNPNIPSSNEETISYQFYSDLDGTFSASANYNSPGGKQYSCDQHTGNTAWEIWIGVLPMYQGDLARTERALVRYFQKNHDYRVGVNALPRSFVQLSEHATATTQTEHNNLLESFRTGQYAWQPFSTAASARIYFNSPPQRSLSTKGTRLSKPQRRRLLRRRSARIVSRSGQTLDYVGRVEPCAHCVRCSPRS